MGVGIIIWTVVIVVIVFLLLSIFLISRIKLIIRKDMERLNKKLNAFQEHIENAELIINEINILSDYVANEIEKANNKFTDSITELNTKISQYNKISQELTKITNDCNNVIEKYTSINNNLSPITNIEKDLDGFQPKKNSVEESEKKKDILILNLYKKGKDIRDIAKSLDIGQREVKLIIDIYNDNN